MAETCPRCYGTGKTSCPDCEDGYRRNPAFPYSHREFLKAIPNGLIRCSTCQGSGKVTCSLCAGTGKVGPAPEQQRDLRACPVCARNDQSQSVETILTYGMAGQSGQFDVAALRQQLAFNESAFENVCEVDYKSALDTANAVVRAAEAPRKVYRQVAETRLRVLSGWQMALLWFWLIGPGLFAGVALGFTYLIVPLVAPQGFQPPVDHALLILVLGLCTCLWLGGALWVWLRPSKVDIRETQEAAEARVAKEVSTAKANAARVLSRVKPEADDKKRRARTTFNSLYYCARDNVVYLPGSSSAVKPGAEIYPYLVKEAS